MVDYLLKTLVMGVLVGVFFGIHVVIASLVGGVIALLITLWLVCKFLRMVGLFAMFPGYFRFYRGAVEATYSKSWIRKIKLSVEALNKFSDNIRQNKPQTQNLDEHIACLIYVA